MTSDRRSSSQGVQHLKAQFEAKDDNNLSPLRGLSPSNDLYPASRGSSGRHSIRTSFVSVEPSGQLPDQNMEDNEIKPSANAALGEHSRKSFSLSNEQDQDAINELKTVVSNEAERRKSIPGLQNKVVPESAVTTAAPTPIPEDPEPASPETSTPAARGEEEQDQSSTSSPPNVVVPGRELQTEHQEKMVSAIEDDGELRPGDPKDASIMSGEEAVAEPVSKLDGTADQTKNDGITHTTANSASKRASKLTPMKSTPVKSTSPKTTLPKAVPAKATPSKQRESAKATASSNKSEAPRPSFATSAPKAPKPTTSRSSLAGSNKFSASTTTRPSAIAGTAASASRSRPSSRPSILSPDAKKGHRLSTQPIPLSEHLTAPTTSSKAKHEPDQPTGKRVTSNPKPIPAHLMAPTASSAAKHEPDGQAASGSTAIKRQPASTAQKRDRMSTSSASNGLVKTKSAPRPSLLGPSNRAPVRPADTKTPATVARQPPTGFLDRMMKPTTASSSKTHEKAEPAKQSPPAKAKSPAFKVPSAKESPTGPAKSTASKAPSKVHSAPMKHQVNGTATKKPASTKEALAKPLASGSPRRPKTVSKSSPAAPSPASKRRDSAVAPSTPSKNTTKPQPKSTPTTAAKAPTSQPDAAAQAPYGDGTTEEASKPEWKAATLPLTPQSEKKDPMENGGLVNGNHPPLTPAGPPENVDVADDTPAKKAGSAVKARRSMMETPDLGGLTIH